MASKVVAPRQQLKETCGGWKTSFSKPGRTRTPLGDLSNSIKPSLNQPSKKHNSVTGASQNSLNGTKKNVQTAARKPLSDISNSGKPNLNEESKKKLSAKLSVLAQEPIDANAIAQEQFLHNHEQCIKAQARDMELTQVLHTLGLDFSKQQARPFSVEVESPPRYFEVKEMPEEMITEDQSWKNRLDSTLDSPRSPKYFMNYDCNLKLLEFIEAELLKH